MADIGKAYVEIIPKAPGIEGKIGSLISPGAKSGGEKGGKTAGAGFGKTFVKTIAGLGIGTAITTGIKTALDEGGKLQQSFGGLDTIYGDASNAAKKYAREASKAGISANDYAEQAVSFGASLKQAFEGDTTKAVEAANTAIMDMTDNAAKMGTPIENIQNAYQGFAKQNYTMLDNLKLGFGGTKSEMERLLETAEKSPNNVLGKSFDINNLGDVYEAIHIIQQDLGLTGVAAQEASTTFTGSLGAMQASAKNLFASLSTGEGVQQSMAVFLQSVGTFVTGNLIPMLGNIVTSLPGAVMTAIDTALPVIQTEGPKFINSLVTGIITGIPKLYSTASSLIATAAATITENLPTILDKGIELVTNFVGGIFDNLPSVYDSANDIVDTISNFLQDNIPVIGEKGGAMLAALAEDIVTNLPTITLSILQLVGHVAIELAKLVPKALSAAGQMISGLVLGVKLGWGKIKTVASDLVDKKIIVPLKTAVTKVTGIGSSIKLTLVNAFNNIKTRAENLWNKIKNAITKPIQDAKDTVSDVVDSITGFFPISIGKIFSNFQTPKVENVGGKSIDNPPNFRVTWKAKGGLFDGPSVIGVGEAGREAVIPLSGQNMRPFAEAIASEMGGAQGSYTWNITVDGAENPEEFADRMIRELKLVTRMA